LPITSLRRQLTLAVLLCLSAGTSYADESPYFFYHGRDYGSEAMVQPLRMVINSGFGIMQLDNRNNRLWEVDYRRGWNTLSSNLRHPIQSIESEGWGDFLRKEILPFSTGVADARYWPNYSQHLIGGGMSYRLLLEWYRWHEYPTPTAWAIASIAAYHMVNEVVELEDFDGWTTDPIADLYLFDPLSCILFSSDRVAGFFANTLNMEDWSFQPAYGFEHGTITNNGQNFAMKYPLPGSERWSLFYHYGTHGEFGLSRKNDKGYAWSFGAGLKAKNLLEFDDKTRGVDLAPVAGIWYDRDGSLLASVVYAATKRYRLRVNIYPGVIRIGSISPSFFLVMDRDERILTGLGLEWLPMGLATRLNR
jgi:hypothetical protein